MVWLFLFHIIIHYEKQGAKKRPKTKSIMKWVYYLYFFACSITLSKAQATDEGCITCAVGKFFETGLEDWILPTAAGPLHFFVPDSSPAPDTIPNETDNQGTNNNPESVNEPDIEIQTIASPDDKKCDPNGAGVSVIPASLACLICSQL